MKTGFISHLPCNEQELLLALPTLHQLYGRKGFWFRLNQMELQSRKGMQRRWEQGQAALQEYRNTAAACRDRVREPRAQLELHVGLCYWACSQQVEGSGSDKPCVREL